MNLTPDAKAVLERSKAEQIARNKVATDAQAILWRMARRAKDAGLHGAKSFLNTRAGTFQYAEEQRDPRKALTAAMEALWAEYAHAHNLYVALTQNHECGVIEMGAEILLAAHHELQELADRQPKDSAS